MILIVTLRLIQFQLKLMDASLMGVLMRPSYQSGIFVASHGIL